MFDTLVVAPLRRKHRWTEFVDARRQGSKPRRVDPAGLPIADLAVAHTIDGSPVSIADEQIERSFDQIRKPSTGTGTCHGALLVATGQLDAFLLLGAGPWDIAALVPIIEEAGGTYAELVDTRSPDTASALFTNPDLHQQIIDIANQEF